MRASYDQELTESIMSHFNEHEAIKLSSLTSWSWDRLEVFDEGASAVQIEEAVGADVLGSKYLFDRTLLVFLQDGRPVHAATTYIAFSFGPGESRVFTDDVTVTPVETPDHTGWIIRLL
ncbi:MAG: hypothetical protein LBK42_06930 [Propionibacteriaceae bacterium]|nr:hypothetical protein [Propionibacteriaceae bacterium]